jgi:predicted membrane-bound spermidine synthase
MFFLSGAGALVLETVWFSQAGLVVGNSVWSAALVVAAFMAGLGLGNAAAMALARRWKQPLRGYALVETLAAVSGALLVAAFPHLPALFGPILAPLVDDVAALNAARLGIAFTLMLIPATALGASLPLVAKPLEALTGSYGFALGRLYGINTLGAVGGTLAAELVLIPSLGLRGSGFAGAACNLAAALIALRVSGSIRNEDSRPSISSAAFAGRGRVLAAAFLAGGALLALEVVGFRFLLLFIDGTALIFAVMLAVVLAGIALGGLVAARVSRRRPLSGGLARIAAAAAGVAVVGAYAAYPWLLAGLAPVHPQSLASAALLCAFLLAAPALLSGFLFTALGERLRSGMVDAGVATGALTLANTLGAMLGSLLAASVLLPALGLERSFFALALVYAVAVLVIPRPEASRWSALRPVLTAAAALALFPFGTMAEKHWRGVEQRFAGRIVAAREGVEQTTFYLAHDFLGEPLFLRLATNSYSMASTAIGVQRYMKLFAYLPAALHPRIEHALLICFGVGMTAAALTDLPDLRSLEVVDVSSDILQMSTIVHPDPARHPLRDPRVRTHVEDGRFFLQTTSRRYDLITGEPPPPKMAGVASLYTREYFGLVKDHLNPAGIATYWLPAYLLLEDEALAIIRAFCEAFEDCSLWSGFHRDWILVGSRGGIAPVTREQFSRLWTLERPGSELRRLGVDSPVELAALFMADADALRELTAGTAPLVDNHPRRIRSTLYTEPPRHALWLMDAESGRRRLETSPWAGILPSSVVAQSGEAFRRRAILDRTLFPALRGADYNFWSDIAFVLRRTELVELPRWLLGSGTQAAAIAARRGASDPAFYPIAAEHLLIDALAHRRPPPSMDQAAFAAMTPRAQALTVFHHCLFGDQGRQLMGWMLQPDAALSAWAARGCAPAG